MPKIEKIDSEIEISCLKYTICNFWRKVCVNYKTLYDKLNIVMCRYPKSLKLEHVEVELKLSEYQKFLSKRDCLLRYIDIFFKRCTILDETTILIRSVFHQKMDALILVSIIRFHPKVKTKIYTIVLEKTSASASVTVQTSQFR